MNWSKLDSVTEVTNNLQNTVEEIQIEVDRQKASDKWIGALSNSTNGQQTLHEVHWPHKLLGKMMKCSLSMCNTIKNIRNSMDQLKKLKLRTPAGTFVTLGEVAKIDIAEGPVSIQRVDQAHSVTFNVKYESSSVTW